MLSDLVLPSPFVVFFLHCDRLTEIVHMVFLFELKSPLEMHIKKIFTIK